VLLSRLSDVAATVLSSRFFKAQQMVINLTLMLFRHLGTNKQLDKNSTIRNMEDVDFSYNTPYLNPISCT